MNRFETELARLYGLPAGAGSMASGPDTVAQGADMWRVCMLGIARPAHWDSLAPVWHGVQADGGLPAPAIAVNGRDGLALWFSLAEPVEVARLAAWVGALRARYMAAVPPERVLQWPPTDNPVPFTSPHVPPHASLQAQRAPTVLPATGAGSATFVPRGATAFTTDPEANAAAVVAGAPGLPLAAGLPTREVMPGQWSAFVAPDLARLFEQEPWLDCPSGTDAQADVLQRLQTTAMADWVQAEQRWGAQPSAVAAPLAFQAHQVQTSAVGSVGAVGASPQGMGPRAFLRQLMNNPQVDLPLRVEAAKALLPHVAD